MKKIKTLGIVTVVLLVIIIAVAVILSLLDILKIEKNPDGNGNIIFTPFEKKNEFFSWQTENTKGDITAEINSDCGKITVKLADCEAGKKFISLCENGAFDETGFSVAAENMFIQCNGKGESFFVEQTEYAPVNGAVAFVIDGENAACSFIIITASELSQTSKNYISEKGFDSEKTELFENFGGIPEYENNVVVFGMVTFGEDTLENIFRKENSGYTGGFSLTEPVNISDIKIVYPTEE